MCGIAGVVDLCGQAEISMGTLKRMANAILHRGPDEEGYLQRPGLGFASRRLSIVGLADGQQPIFNEDQSIMVVFNGELFDYVEKRQELEAKGHQFRTSCDTEVLVHMWEEHGEDMLPLLRGQFAFALYDSNQKKVIIARDRLGICPLHWAQRGDRVYFGSEIKAILASGEVAAEVDPRGLDHVMMFFAMATRRTAFKGISAIYPGNYLRIQFRPDGEKADVAERCYWDLDFPDQGDEYDPGDTEKLTDEFEAVFRHAVELRLRADVPVVSYLSGGVDSTSVLAMASQIRQSPVKTFTIQIKARGLDETDRAMLASNTVGSDPTIVTCESETLSRAYPQLVEAAEAPVMDTSCSALYSLAAEVRRQGYKVALTGEGADEALAGYPWFKLNRLVNLLDSGSFRPSNVIRRLAQWWNGAGLPPGQLHRVQKMVGGPHACVDLYGTIGMGRPMFYDPDWYKELGTFVPYEDLDLNLDRMKNWHPLNQSLYLGYKTMLPGLLMNHKGDRPAMHNSVETRYPFLDEDVVAFCSRVHPKYKLRGFRRDKYLLRQYARRMLPATITNRPKAMFRAPFANTFFDSPPAFVNQLLSPESLKKTGYFNAEAVQQHRQNYFRSTWASGRRLIIEMGLTGVMATQLWHHLFLGGGLCELPTWDPNAARSEQPMGV